MKKMNFNLLCISIVLIGLTGCKKENISPEEKENKTGSIKVPVSYSMQSNSSSYIYYLDGPITVQLKKDWNDIATQQATQISTLDFGIYEYGNYQVRGSGKIRRTQISTGSSSIYRHMDQTVEFVLNSPTATVNINL